MSPASATDSYRSRAAATWSRSICEMVPLKPGGGARACLAGRAQGRARGRGQCLGGLRPTSWQVVAHTRVLWAVSGRPSPKTPKRHRGLHEAKLMGRETKRRGLSGYLQVGEARVMHKGGKKEPGGSCQRKQCQNRAFRTLRQKSRQQPQTKLAQEGAQKALQGPNEGKRRSRHQ
jgi:hypothetical protein